MNPKSIVLSLSILLYLGISPAVVWAQSSEPTRDELNELVKQRRAELAEATAAVFSELRGLIPVTDPRSADEILAALRDDEVIVSYVWSDAHVSLIAAHRGQIVGHTLAENEDVPRLREQVERLHDSLVDPTLEPDRAAAQRIRASIFPDEVMDMIEASERVAIVADGPLLSIPMDLIISDARCVYAPSATVYVDRQQLARQNRGPQNESVVIVGDPVFREYEADTMLAMGTRSGESIEANASALDQVRLHGGRLARLPFTQDEAIEAKEASERAGLSTRLLLGAEANVPTLREAVESKPRYLHIATHGLVGSTDRPYEASLALTQPEDPSPENIGFLTLRELMTEWLFRLNGCELVVLSACDTARGVSEGDTVMSLPLGFFAAGAESVLASLWRVDDRATSLLMGRFYENLLGIGATERTIDGDSYAAGDPIPKLAALREAQQWLRTLTVDDLESMDISGSLASRGPSPARGARSGETKIRNPYSHPYYWAAFTLRGASE